LLFLPILQKVEEMGFELWDINGGRRDKANGRILQGDAVFFRK
jgi:hypothetical protein